MERVLILQEHELKFIREHIEDLKEISNSELSSQAVWANMQIRAYSDAILAMLSPAVTIPGKSSL